MKQGTENRGSVELIQRVRWELLKQYDRAAPSMCPIEC